MKVSVRYDHKTVTVCREQSCIDFPFAKNKLTSVCDVLGIEWINRQKLLDGQTLELERGLTEDQWMQIVTTV